MQHIDVISQKAHPARWQLTGWLVWSIAALFYAYEFLHRVAPSVLTSQLREAFSVNDLQLGMIGAMYFYAYSAFQLPAGIMIDRFGAKKLLVIASAVLTLGSFMFTTTDSSLIAHVSRFMIGMGSAFAFVGCLKIGAQWLASSSFPIVVGLTNLCGTLGALSGGLPLSYWVEQIGWRETLLQVSFMGLLITLLMWIFLPKDQPQALAKQSTRPELFAGIKEVIRSPQSWVIALYGTFLVAPIAALPEMWGVDYLKTAYQLTGTQAATITHSIFIGTALGGPILGWLVGRFKNPVNFMRLSTIGALLLLSLFLYGSNIPATSLTMILVCYGVFTSNMLLCFSMITKLHPARAQGAAIGFTNMVIMAGAGLIQHFVGWVLHHLRSLHEGHFMLEDYRLALMILPVCLLLAICITVFMKGNHNAV
jgi:predicted MFS family arabinose efflux permease